MIDTRLVPYEITARPSAEGMGEVSSATDARLERPFSQADSRDRIRSRACAHICTSSARMHLILGESARETQDFCFLEASEDFQTGRQTFKAIFRFSRRLPQSSPISDTGPGILSGHAR